MTMTKPTSEQVTFLAAGSGATQRTVLDKLREAASVKDFGAIGDGIADDTAAIQAAINSGYSNIYVPKGVYKIGSQVTVPAGITMHGDGSESEFAMLSSLDTMFSVTGDNVHFRHLALRGTDTEISASANERLIVAEQRTNVTVEHCELMETIIAVQYEESDSCSMSCCYVHDIRHRIDLSQGYGILCNVDNKNITIENNRFHDIGRHAIYVGAGADNVSISGNVVDVCESVAINVAAFDTQNPCANIAIVGNTIRDVSGTVTPAGINIAGNTDNISVSGNSLYDIQDAAILVEGSFSYAQADNPRRISIVGNSAHDSLRAGILILNSSQVVISGNACSACDTGIFVSSSSSGIGALFADVLVSGNQCINSTDYGMTVGGTASCTGLHLSGNTVRGSGLGDYNLPSGNGTSVPSGQIKFSDAIEQYLFTAGSVAAGVTNQVMDAPISGLGSYRPQGKRYALSMSANISSAITAGTATIRLFKNASVQASYDVVLNSSNQSAVNVQAIRQTFSATDEIIVKVTTDGSFAVASTSNIQAVVRLVDLAD